MVKVIIAGLLLGGFSFAADSKKPPEAKSQPTIRFRHIQDPTGKILATIDSNDQTIEYKVDPKEVVSEMVRILDVVSAECQKTKGSK